MGEVIVDGVVFVFDETGTKLVKKGSEAAAASASSSTSSKAPLRTSVNGQSFIRTKRGNLISAELHQQRKAQKDSAAKMRRLAAMGDQIANNEKTRCVRSSEQRGRLCERHAIFPISQVCQPQANPVSSQLATHQGPLQLLQQDRSLLGVCGTCLPSPLLTCFLFVPHPQANANAASPALTSTTLPVSPSVPAPSGPQAVRHPPAYVLCLMTLPNRSEYPTAFTGCALAAPPAATAPRAPTSTQKRCARRALYAVHSRASAGATREASARRDTRLTARTLSRRGPVRERVVG